MENSKKGQAMRRNSGFPTPDKGRHYLLRLIYMHGCRVMTKCRFTGWDVYITLADWFCLSGVVRSRQCSSDNRAAGAWRAYVGYRRKELEMAGFIKSAIGRRGIWELTERGIDEAKRSFLAT
jgi:hypothetical protein